MDNNKAVAIISAWLVELGLTPEVMETKFFANVKASEYPGQVFRVQDGVVRTLTPIKSYGFTAQFANLEKRKPVFIRLFNLLESLNATYGKSDIAALVESILDWTSNPGNTQAGIRVEKHPIMVKALRQKADFTKIDGSIYRGVNLTPEEFKRLLEGDPLKSRGYESYSFKMRTAEQFAKGNMIGRSQKSTIGVLFEVDQWDKAKVILNIPKFRESNPKLIQLVESGVFKGEVSTLWLDEVILSNFNPTRDHILKAWNLNTGKRIKL